MGNRNTVNAWHSSDDLICCHCVLQNEEINGDIYKNITFMCADVTSPELKIEDNSIDIVFSNWLLMYLNDEEVIKIMPNL